ncbi:glycoside hydrolase family 15 protein [Streptomyces erythrochromogenes]|uniref:glycoside hydrolase family 15 protein n=1 Tax=Streptomyces erythrochromogenes TaxID=285574 RepID=UPI003412DAEA
MHSSPSPAIEEFAFLSNGQTSALLDASGAVSYMPGGDRPDSDLLFARTLGSEDNGLWRIRPHGQCTVESRRYLPNTMILETVWRTEKGKATVLDYMPPTRPGSDSPGRLFREVRLQGQIAMDFDFRPRFQDGRTVSKVTEASTAHPWKGWRFHDGDQVVTLAAQGMAALAKDPADGALRGTVYGRTTAFVLTLGPDLPRALAPRGRRKATRDRGLRWVAGNVSYEGRYEELVKRSMLTLDGLRYVPTGAYIAAATTSLPEELGGVRNWDYQHHWWRDAEITLDALIAGGAKEGLEEWRRFALGTIGDDVAGVPIMCGVGGERELPERVIEHLSGYEGSRPVRRGNAAIDQFQLDLYGSIARAFARIASKVGWTLESARMVMELARAAETRWTEPDSGLWESRGGLKHHTYSKAMAWVAVDCASKLAGSGDVPELHDPREAGRLRAVADVIHADVLTHGFDSDQGSFTQSYGARDLDAALLRLPLVGFIAASDPRMVGTLDALMDQLADDRGFMLRYRTHGDRSADGLPGHEGRFLLCSFWLVEVLAMVGRGKEAAAIFDTLATVAGGLGLLAEEFQPSTNGGRQLGNFPQALSHAGLARAAVALHRLRAWTGTSWGAAA